MLNNQVRVMRYITRVIRTLVLGGELPEKPSDIPWEAVFVLANRHTVAGTLWYALENTVRAEASEELVKRWDGQRNVEFAKNVVQTREFARLTALLTENKHPFLPMKGFIFKALWKRPEYRSMADMDFCVREEDMDAISALLIADGYTADVVDDCVHDTFNKPPYIHIELHKTLFHGSTESFECWIPREDNPYWYVMSPEDFVTFNVGHIHKHYVGGGCGARSLFDLYLYLTNYKDELDRRVLEEKLREKKLYDFFCELLHLIYYWYGNGTYPFEPSAAFIRNGAPTDPLLEMEYFITTGGAYGTESNRVKYGVEHKGRFRYALGSLFPRWRIMSSFFPWLKKCPILLPLAYPLRWLVHLFSGKLWRFVKHLFGSGKNKKDA